MGQHNLIIVAIESLITFVGIIGVAVMLKASWILLKRFLLRFHH